MTTSNFGYLVLGSAIGAGITYFIFKRRMEEIVDIHEEEIQSVKDAYEKKPKAKPVKKEEEKREADDMVKNKEIINENKYSKVDNKDNQDHIFFVSSEEFGSDPDYTTSPGYTYYSDGVLTDEYDEVVNKPENLVGDFEKHFGDYDEVVYVRNTQLKIEIEILKDRSPYYDDKR